MLRGLLNTGILYWVILVWNAGALRETVCQASTFSVALHRSKKVLFTDVGMHNSWLLWFTLGNVPPITPGSIWATRAGEVKGGPWGPDVRITHLFAFMINLFLCKNELWLPLLNISGWINIIYSMQAPTEYMMHSGALLHLMLHTVSLLLIFKIGYYCVHPWCKFHRIAI